MSAKNRKKIQYVGHFFGLALGIFFCDFAQFG